MNPVEDLRSIFSKAINRVDPYRMITNNMRIEGDMLLISYDGQTLQEDLGLFTKILVLGIGKASSKMGKAIEDILGDKITSGSVITKYGHGERLDLINVMEAGHPIPDEKSVSGAKVLFEMARGADERTLIINLVSGGGSALFSLPQEGIKLSDVQEMTKILLDCGADIREINCIRKHISRVKGGHFARISYPAKMINIILSDVIGDRLDTIASGITVADNTTFAEARDIVEKYHIKERMPTSIWNLIQSGLKGEIPDTPKEGDPVFNNVTNILLGNNLAACKAAKDHGKSLGYNAYIITSSLSGEAREIAKFFTSIAKDTHQGTSDFIKPALIVAGGETTVTIKGGGKGGRNQEMALAFLIDMIEGLDPFQDIYFLSGGTDGNDGPTDAAGAFVWYGMKDGIVQAGLNPIEYLENNDSYHFFKQIGGLLITGPTNTNVCDIQLLAVV